MDSPTISAWSGRSASWPETNTSPPALIACEYGAPWNGAGAASVSPEDAGDTQQPVVTDDTDFMVPIGIELGEI